MKIDFDTLKKVAIQRMNGGQGTVTANMCMAQFGKVILSSLAPRSSIGIHAHDTSIDINYVIQGEGIAVCNGEEEELHPGICHICPQGASHSIRNMGDCDLVMFTVVVEQ